MASKEVVFAGLCIIKNEIRNELLKILKKNDKKETLNLDKKVNLQKESPWCMWDSVKVLALKDNAAYKKLFKNICKRSLMIYSVWLNTKFRKTRRGLGNEYQQELNWKSHYVT